MKAMTRFPPTSFQVSNLNAGTGANNVIPGELTALINFRYCTASRADDLRARTETILQRHGLRFVLDWNLSGEPFLTPPDGALREAVVAAYRRAVRHRPRTKHRRRHLRRPLHRADRRRGRGARSGQRDHP